jgi:hypothetical protein
VGSALPALTQLPTAPRSASTRLTSNSDDGGQLAMDVVMIADQGRINESIGLDLEIEPSGVRESSVQQLVGRVTALLEADRASRSALFPGRLSAPAMMAPASLAPIQRLPSEAQNTNIVGFLASLLTQTQATSGSSAQADGGPMAAVLSAFIHPPGEGWTALLDAAQRVPAGITFALQLPPG